MRGELEGVVMGVGVVSGAVNMSVSLEVMPSGGYE